MNKWVNRKLDEKRTTGKGFTLIELIVVVTVLGILAAIVIYAVGNISGAANKSAAGTSSQEVSQAEQAYCQANGVYGNETQLTQGGYLTNPNPNLVIYTYTIPSNGQYFNACGTGQTGSVYDAYPQTITQPDGTSATIPAPPAANQVLLADSENFLGEILAALGVTPYGGIGNGASPLVNSASYNTLGTFDYQAYAAAKPALILGQELANGGPGFPVSFAQHFEAIAPTLSIYTRNQINYPTNPQALDLSLMDWVPTMVAVADVMNLQVQAAEFITTFQNAAAAVEPQLAGKSVSVLIPYASYFGSPALLFEGLNGDLEYDNLFAYLGMNLVCPNCAAPNNILNSQYAMPIANISASTVTAQYLVVLDDGAANETFANSLFGPNGTYVKGSQALPQATGGPGDTSDICGPGPGNWGVGCTGTGPSSVTPTLTAPLTNYCSIAGVSQQQVDSTINTSYQAMCPGYTAVTTAGPTATPWYTPQPLAGGVPIDGPLTELAAIPYMAAQMLAIPS